jgi:hypothetical protein
MLKTPKETLAAISKKEDMEYRMTVSLQNKRKLNNLSIIERDHLPFAKMKMKIACGMNDAPKRPLFKTVLPYE